MNQEYSREWWEERLEIIQAFVDGDTVGFGDGEHFEELKTPEFRSLPQNYRFKPKAVAPDEVWVNVYNDDEDHCHKSKQEAEDLADDLTALAIAVRYVRAED